MLQTEHEPLCGELAAPLGVGFWRMDAAPMITNPIPKAIGSPAGKTFNSAFID
jgi:hypothetical protein